MTLADKVAANETRLHHLELKSDADDNLIALLKKQNELQAIELTEVKHTHDCETQKLRHERDVAVRNATEVSGIVETLGSLALTGIRKMRGDETPAVIPDRPPLIVKHLQTSDKALPPVKPEQDELLPRPSFRGAPADPERQLPLRVRA